MRPSVSVVVPVFNAAKTIGDMLAALLPQAGMVRLAQFIVVDNGSTDDTRDIVRRFGVTLLAEKKRGPAAARNCGLRYATGDIIVHLDADTLPTRRWLPRMVAPFADPTTMLVAGRTLSYQTQTPAERYIAAAGLYESDRAMSHLNFAFVPSLNMAVRREAAIAIGGWSEDLMTAEDIDFSYRLLKKFPSMIVYRPDAVLFHRTRSTVEGLRKLAWTYGQGVGNMYLRYPHEVRWNLIKTAKVITRLGVRSLMPVIMQAGKVLGLTSSELLEFNVYHRIWSLSFCGGFLNVYYGLGPKEILQR